MYVLPNLYGDVASYAGYIIPYDLDVENEIVKAVYYNTVEVVEVMVKMSNLQQSYQEVIKLMKHIKSC